jgi:hypothetical protein
MDISAHDAFLTVWSDWPPSWTWDATDCIIGQGLPEDGRDHAGARKRPQNNPWGVVNSARKKKKNVFKKNTCSLLNYFIHFRLQNIAPICLQIPSNVKVTLGKSLIALKYLIYAMQNSPCGTPLAHGNDLTPVKYPIGVTDSSRRYFSCHALSGSWGKVSVRCTDGGESACPSATARKKICCIHGMKVLW